jgi:hypothetical protein
MGFTPWGYLIAYYYEKYRKIVKVSEYKTTAFEISWIIISFLNISQHRGRWMNNIEKYLKKMIC